MKKKFSVLLLLSILNGGIFSTAQTYPFFDDFESYPAFQVPAAYPGNIQVRLVHGTNASQGLGSFMNTFTTKDSATSPLIGPLTSSSGLGFDWRIVSTIASSFVPANLISGDHFNVSISDDGVNFQDILLIDHLNYVPSTDFVHFNIPMATFAGRDIYVKFTIMRQSNPDDYYVDIDNLSASDTTIGTGFISSELSSSFEVYPNPVQSCLKIIPDAKIEKNDRLVIFDLSGSEVLNLAYSEMESGLLDVSFLKPGYYTIVIRDQKGARKRHFCKI